MVAHSSHTAAGEPTTRDTAPTASPTQNAVVHTASPTPTQSQALPHVASITAVDPTRTDRTTLLQYSALSIKSIQTKKQLEAQQSNLQAKAAEQLPEEPFTETDMRLFWTQYADRLGRNGQKILESLLKMNDPVLLMNHKIVHELPNEGSKLDFDSGKYDLLVYLRSHLKNHKIEIEVKVNESVESKRAYTPQEKFQRLLEINPAIDTLRKTFDLNF